MVEAVARDILDLCRYRIDDALSPEYVELVGQCRVSLCRDGFCKLEGFVTRDAVATMREELRELSEGCSGNQRGRQVNAYYTLPDASLPPDHPQNVLFDREFGVVRDDMLHPSCRLRLLYNCPWVLRLVADVLDVPRVFQSRDAYQALTVNVMKEGESLHWHFDCNECAITLGLQAPEGGGQLEFVPDIGRESFADIQAVIFGSTGYPQQLQQEEVREDRNKEEPADAAQLFLTPKRDMLEGKQELEENFCGVRGVCGSEESRETLSNSEPELKGSAVTKESSLSGTTGSDSASVSEGHSNIFCKRLEVSEGALVFFRGGQSLHRVLPVRGKTTRLVAALQFHLSDSAHDAPEMTKRIYGVLPSEHRGRKETVVSAEQTKALSDRLKIGDRCGESADRLRVEKELE
uniref:Fe2OG dioxygenase domain-containing protein n=1 Tax=Chromera velia CCMP2878 TaxID=1169474 RepID=A0A0G4H8N7_9ALVE|eukprot:Cvel_25212.t1-p1 / transcript=Cvel_25212.t1 / gene=Cvel_25212 / organism=Chromera_velia_CCMP2878 / gene_product=hypothetical protein / transcript_product=hypothetical protein / location=Cvel_scaffold2826:10551-12746(+) / protein_length=405 / sequence_SO=supercontig / SO=protein_coding / is_pseudo=false